MLILGIDPASRHLGFGIIEADGDLLAFRDCGVLSAPAAWDKYRRLGEIGAGLEATIKLWSPQAAALEAGFAGPVRGYQQQGVLVSAAARGVAGYLCARAGLSVFEYAPATVKKNVAGHGRAEKRDVVKFVRILLAMDGDPQPDAADALAVAITHARALVAARRVDEAQRRALGA